MTKGKLCFQGSYGIIKEQTHLSYSGNVFLEKVKLFKVHEIRNRLNVIIRDPKGLRTAPDATPSSNCVYTLISVITVCELRGWTQAVRNA